MAKEVKLVKFMLHGREVTAPQSTFEIAREHFGAELLSADDKPAELRKPLITPPKLPLIEKPVEIVKPEPKSEVVPKEPVADAPEMDSTKPTAKEPEAVKVAPKAAPKPVSRAKPKKK